MFYFAWRLRNSRRARSAGLQLRTLSKGTVTPGPVEAILSPSTAFMGGDNDRSIEIDARNSRHSGRTSISSRRCASEFRQRGVESYAFAVT
jgi:hypothetical protein